MIDVNTIDMWNLEEVKRMSKCYKAYQLVVRSECSLPLPEVEAESFDVDLTFNKINKVSAFMNDDLVEYSYSAEDELLICWPAIGKMLIQRGNTVQIDKNGVCSLSRALLPVPGTVMSVILCQRGLTVLHGSCVRKDHRGLIFVGEKGYGKSTLGAWMNNNGYPFVSDDVCALEGIAGDIYIRPSFPTVKLYPEVLRFIGDEPGKYEKVHPQIEKRRVPIQHFSEKNTNVKAICVLAGGEALRLDVLYGMEAIQELLKHMMINRFAEGQPSNLMAQVFQQVSRLVQNVPIYRLTRPRDLRLLPETQELLDKIVFADG